MKKHRSLLFFLLAFPIITLSCSRKESTEPEPPPDSTTVIYEKTFGGSADDYAFSLLKGANGAMMIGGHTFSYGTGQSDMYCINVDTAGDTLWTRTYGGAGVDEARSLLQLSDGNAIIVGLTDSYGMGWTDIYMLTIDQSGNLLWSATYGTPRNEQGREAIQTFDDCYLIAGFTECRSVANTDLYLVKTDEYGDTLWTRTYGDSLQFDEGAFGVIESMDSCFVVLGEKRYSHGWGWIWLMKTNEHGDSIWANVYGGSNWDRGHSMIQSEDNCAIIAGSIEANTEDNGDVLLMKVDDTGDEVWTMKYGGSADDVGYSVAKTSDGGYIIAGSTKSFGNQWAEDVYIIKTNGQGEEEWSENFGGDLPDYAYAVMETDDGDFVVAGFTSSYGAGSYDIYLLRISHE